jgi:MFS family permease
MLALATGWMFVLGLRVADRTGKGLRSSARDALIADATPAAIRGRAFGLHRAMDTAGALVGSLLAALLLWGLRGVRDGARPYRVIFVISAGAGLAAVALTFLVREPPRAQPFAIANSSDTFLLLRAADVGLSPWAVVLAYSMYNAVYALGSYPAGVISDRVGRWGVIGIGWATYAVVYAGFALADSTSIWPLFAIYGLYMALTDGVGKALIVDHAPPEHRGRALGIFYLATGAVTVISSVAAGVLWDRVGPAAPFWLGAGAATVAVAILPFVVRRLRSGQAVEAAAGG